MWDTIEHRSRACANARVFTRGLRNEPSDFVNRGPVEQRVDPTGRAASPLYHVILRYPDIEELRAAFTTAHITHEFGHAFLGDFIHDADLLARFKAQSPPSEPAGYGRRPSLCPARGMTSCPSSPSMFCSLWPRRQAKAGSAPRRGLPFGTRTAWRRNEVNDLRAGERSIPSPSPPPLAPAKAFSHPGCGRIFPLFSRVVREGLSTATCARRPGSGLSGPIFSGPDHWTRKGLVHATS
jgi:hypothetical protein